MPFTLENTADIEKHLANNPYLSEGGLPGVEDARIFLQLNGAAPDVTKTANFHYWYHFMSSFTVELLKTWTEKGHGAKGQAQQKGQKTEKPAGKKQEKKEEKKQEKKAEKKEDSDDLFGQQEQPKKKPAPKPQAPPADKKKKEKPVAKSIVVFQVKVYDQETNLDQLAKRILQRKIEGLVWNNQPKKLDVAYGMQKLQLGCVIEDDKVLTDDIFDPIQQWPEVQSVDMTSMQKL